jgi:hypothetical protein
MPIFRILFKGVLRVMSLTLPFLARERLDGRPDLVIVRVSKSLFQAVKKRGDRRPAVRTGLAPHPSGSPTPWDAGSLSAGSRNCRFKVSDYHR